MPMNLKSVLLFLFEKLGHGSRHATVSFQQMLMWENGILPILLEERLLIETNLATKLPCKCGHKDCLMSVLAADLSDEVTGKIVGTAYYGICGKNHSSVGFLTEFERCYLKQWQLTNEMLIAWLTNYLRLEPPKEANRAGVIQIGTATLSGETYALELGTSDELVLLVNGNAVPIADIFQVSEGGAIEVDTSLIEQHKCRKTVEAAPVKLKKSPSAKQQVNQTETQKRQAGWQKLYLQQLKNHPNKSKTWHSEQIEKKIAERGEKPVSAKHIFKYLKHP